MGEEEVLSQENDSQNFFKVHLSLYFLVYYAKHILPIYFWGLKLKEHFFHEVFFLVGGSKNTLYDICITKYVQM